MQHVLSLGNLGGKGTLSQLNSLAPAFHAVRGETDTVCDTQDWCEAACTRLTSPLHPLRCPPFPGHERARYQGAHYRIMAYWHGEWIPAAALG